VGCFEEVGGTAADEVVAVGVEGAHKVLNFVGFCVGHEIAEALWVEIVGVDETFLLACWDSEWTHARHDIAYGVSFVEKVAQSLVLGVQARVPVHFGKVESKRAALLADGDIHVIRAVQDFVLEGAVCVFSAYIVELVDHGAD
jgi:hypothetical protein